MTTYNELVEYLETMPAKITGLKGATVGADEEIFNLQPSRIQYPHLWAETPDVTFVGNDDNTGKRFALGLHVVTNEPKGTNKEANKRLSAMLTLAEEVYAQIVADADSGEFDLILKDDEAAPIRAYSADNLYGWRLEISIELPRCTCDGC